MNTIEGLRQLPYMIKTLLDRRDNIQLKIDSCYKPLKDIIQEVMIKPYVIGLSPSFYVNDEDIGISEDFVVFVIRDYLGKYDDQVVGTYKFPIEAFVSADALRKYIEEHKVEGA